MPSYTLPHLLLIDPPANSRFTSPKSGGKPPNVPPRDRKAHGQYLIRRLDQAWHDAKQEQAVSHSDRNGVYLEFVSDPDAVLVIKSLEDLKSGQVRLLNVRQHTRRVPGPPNGQPVDQKVTLATVYVANSKRRYFMKKLEDYIQHNTTSGKPKNDPLIRSISDIRKAVLGSFWPYQKDPWPDLQPEWIEVWISSHEPAVMRRFEALIRKLQLPVREGALVFPERSVKVVQANAAQLTQLTVHFDSIAEFRRAKTTARFFLNLAPKDQAQWTQDLLGRIRVPDGIQNAVCILDTGVNYGHPLLQPLLMQADCQAVNPEWGAHDHDKHGTLMAGMAAFGDLSRQLSHTNAVHFTHRLESVKLLPPPPLGTEANLWGYVTKQAVSLAEIKAPFRKRALCMAVTAPEVVEYGRPSSWSAALDQLTSGFDDNVQRLMIVSAGNCSSLQRAATGYPDSQLDDPVQDPAQSWNVLTAGAFTQLTDLTDATFTGYSPVAQAGQLSPFSTTSASWESNKWPVKPELVLEGGNLAVDGAGFPSEAEDLSLLSTYYRPQDAHFYEFSMTSAATAELARMAGILQGEYPNYWPETIRALLVHSAHWPEPLLKQFAGTRNRTDMKRLLSVCGYGVPDLERALRCARNSLTMISQATIQPFVKPHKGNPRSNEMHLYDLPWPKDLLLELPDDVSVQMRITLSYFVEPGPGEIGWKDRYRYPSHGLRFHLNGPYESRDQFVRRINRAAEDDGDSLELPEAESATRYWTLGSQARDRGSIHSDIWRGSPQELASSNLIAITPTIGWWRERSYLERCNRQARYSLVVSITTSDESVDIYTPVAVQLGIPVPISV